MSSGSRPASRTRDPQAPDSTPSPTISAPVRLGYAGLLRQPSYARVFFAGLGSTAGSALATVCLVWVVYAATASALDVGLLGTAWIGGAIAFSVFGGGLVDRYDRRRLMIASDLARAAAMVAVVLDLLLRGVDLSVLLAANGIVGAATTVFNPAEQAVVPALVAPADVAAANGLVRSSRSGMQFAGAALAGALLVTVGATVGVGLNVATFALSAFLLAGMRLPSVATDGSTVPYRGWRGYLGFLGEGFRWLVRARGLFQLTLSATVFNFCSALVGSFVVVYSTDLLHGSAVDFSLLLSAEIAGSAVGSLLVGRVGAAAWAGLAWTVPYGVVAAGGAIALALVPTLPAALGLFFVLGGLGGFAGTAWLTAAQLLVPTAMQGRYFGIDSLGSVAVLPAAQIGGAFLVQAYGVQRTYLATGIVWAIVGVAFLFPRELRRVGVRTGPDLTPQIGGAVAGTPGSPGGSPGG